MKKRYCEKVKVIKKEPVFGETNNQIEENILVELTDRNTKKKKRIFCFIPDSRNFGRFTEGAVLEIRLKQVTFDTFENPKKDKKIIFTQRTPKVNQCRISGQIKELLPHEEFANSYIAILDFGNYAEIRIYKNKNPKEGEYITAEGRLDAHI